jgi:UDP-GlcNAc:undecaprenyl-phosphate/decaprenyl-phosphate GlcNAc-1-phosphate transferase
VNASSVPDGVRYALAFMVPAIGTLALTPVAARAAHRFSVLDTPGGHKVHRGATPYLGGVAVAAGLVLIGGVTAGTNGELFTILAGALVLGAVGLMDDVRTVSPSIRLVLEGAVGISLWLVGVRAGVLDTPLFDLPITVLWVVAVVNAFNVIDNMDGLAAGVATASAVGIASIAAFEGDFLVASFAFAIAGASLGFLRYNLPPARIFLGDAGSMLLGALIAALTLKLDIQVRNDLARLAAVVLLAGTAIFDLSLVVVARLLGRRKIWLGGTDHASHRLAARGHTNMRVAATFAASQTACSALAVWVYRRDPDEAFITIATVGAAWVVLIALLLRLPHPSLQPGDQGVATADAVAATGATSAPGPATDSMPPRA